MAMKTMVRIAVAVMLLSGLGVAGALAQDCPAVQTLENFTTNPCLNQDKLYTFIATNLPNLGDIDVEIEFFPLGGIDVHNFSINPDSALLGPNAYILEYSVEITDPLRHFSQISIDSDVPAQSADVDIVKEIFSDAAMTNLEQTVTSLDGNPGGPADLPDVTKIWVHEEITIGQLGALNSFTDTFTQTGIPEPATLVLLGVGLVALGFARRRK